MEGARRTHPLNQPRYTWKHRGQSREHQADTGLHQVLCTYTMASSWCFYGTCKSVNEWVSVSRALLDSFPSVCHVQLQYYGSIFLLSVRSVVFFFFPNTASLDCVDLAFVQAQHISSMLSWFGMLATTAICKHQEVNPGFSTDLKWTVTQRRVYFELSFYLWYLSISVDLFELIF